MIGYSGIYSPNNKKNQESIAIRLVYSQKQRKIENHVITNAWHFPAFLYQTAIYVLLR